MAIIMAPKAAEYDLAISWSCVSHLKTITYVLKGGYYNLIFANLIIGELDEAKSGVWCPFQSFMYQN